MDVMCEICGAMDYIKLEDDGQWVCLWMCADCARELETEREYECEDVCNGQA